MRYIKPSFTEIKDLKPYDFIALVGHNCYQVDRTNDNEAFVKRLIKNRHLAMVEHYSYVAKINCKLFDRLIKANNRFLTLVRDNRKCYVEFNLRILLETFDQDKNSPILDLVSLLDDDIIALFEGYEKREVKGKLLSKASISRLPQHLYDKLKFVTLKIITDRGVTHELVRHRICSFAQESTRYCNYAKDKFGNELTFILPIDYKENKKFYDESFTKDEESYLEMMKEGIAPELARSILPNKLKTSIIVTCSVDEWKKIFELRTSPRAHPDMREIMIPIKEYFLKKGYLK